MWSLMSLTICSNTLSECNAGGAIEVTQTTVTDGRRAILVKYCLTNDDNALFVDEIRRKNSIFARIIKLVTQKGIKWLSKRYIAIGEKD